jgi:hypothetical protein
MPITVMEAETLPVMTKSPEKLRKVRGLESAIGLLSLFNCAAEPEPNHSCSILALSFPAVRFKIAIERLCTSGEPLGNT